MNLRAWHASLAEREQRMVTWGAVVAAALLLVGLVWKLGNAATAAGLRVESKRELMAWIEAVTPRLQATPAGRAGESLAIAVDRAARESGLGEALEGIEPAGPGTLRVRFKNASFDALALCLAHLQQERGAITETASVNASGEPGRVDVTLVLRGH
ncbi:MAG: type II secretion system protein GspM [Steroidobacteraceae bacterium]